MKKIFNYFNDMVYGIRLGIKISIIHDILGGKPTTDDFIFAIYKIAKKKFGLNVGYYKYDNIIDEMEIVFTTQELTSIPQLKAISHGNNGSIVINYNRIALNISQKSQIERYAILINLIGHEFTHAKQHAEGRLKGVNTLKLLLDGDMEKYMNNKLEIEAREGGESFMRWLSKQSKSMISSMILD